MLVLAVLTNLSYGQIERIFLSGARWGTVGRWGLPKKTRCKLRWSVPSARSRGPQLVCKVLVHSERRTMGTRLEVCNWGPLVESQESRGSVHCANKGVLSERWRFVDWGRRFLPQRRTCGGLDLEEGTREGNRLYRSLSGSDTSPRPICSLGIGIRELGCFFGIDL